MRTSKSIGTWDKRGYPKYLPYGVCKGAKREAMSESDNRRFCYGLIDLADDEICSACKECGYYIAKEEKKRELDDLSWIAEVILGRLESKNEGQKHYTLTLTKAERDYLISLLRAEVDKGAGA